MERFIKKVEALMRFTFILGGTSLIFIMLLTVSDVLLRYLRMPIVGTYDLVCFAGALVIGFSLPYVSWRRGHIYIDFLINTFSRRGRNIFNVMTRCLGIFLLLIAGWNLIKDALELHKSGEVSPTLTIPYYPFFFLVGICCFFLCLALFCDILKIRAGKYE